MRVLVTSCAGSIASHLVNLLVSGVGGNLKSAYRACCNLLRYSAEEIADLNFFSVFSQPDQRGKSIERCLHLSDMDVFGKESMRVSGRSDFTSSNI